MKDIKKVLCYVSRPKNNFTTLPHPLKLPQPQLQPQFNLSQNSTSISTQYGCDIKATQSCYITKLNESWRWYLTQLKDGKLKCGHEDTWLVCSLCRLGEANCYTIWLSRLPEWLQPPTLNFNIMCCTHLYHPGREEKRGEGEFAEKFFKRTEHKNSTEWPNIFYINSLHC